MAAPVVAEVIAVVRVVGIAVKVVKELCEPHGVAPLWLPMYLSMEWLQYCEYETVGKTRRV